MTYRTPGAASSSESSRAAGSLESVPPVEAAGGAAHVGFVGLGAMGLPMAVNLARAGTGVLAWNRSRPALERASAEGCRVAATLAEVAAACPTVVTMLPDLPQVRDVLDSGLLSDGSVMRTLVVMGTVSPVAVRALAAELAPRGVSVVDAPVSGGRKSAVDGTLSIMVGGADGDVAGVLPYLRAMGRTVRHMGPVGAGSLAKACNQLVVAGTLAALAEAVLLGETGGLDTRTLLEVLAGGLAASEVLEQKREHLVFGDFHGSGPVGFLVKDLGFVRHSAAAQHVALPVTEAAARLYNAAVARGQGDLDNSVVLDVLRHPSSDPAPHPTRETFLTADPR